MIKHVTYLEEVLHLKVDFTQYANVDILPLYLRNSYELYKLAFSGVECLLALPLEQTNLTVLRKQCIQLKKLTGLDCVLCLENVRIYTKDKMLAEGIPFIIPGQQIYMPFLGIALAQNGAREIKSVESISFSTQKLLLSAIYHGWKNISLTDAAEAQGVSKMTITRCFDELQVLDLPLIVTARKSRSFVWKKDRRALWETVRSFLKNPVITQYRFDASVHIDSAKLSGISAISHYSMLADNAYTVYAVSGGTANELKLDRFPRLPDNEVPYVIVQLLRYDYDYPDSAAIDPLTAILTLTNDEKTDPRVEAAIEEILKECLHD